MASNANGRVARYTVPDRSEAVSIALCSVPAGDLELNHFCGVCSAALLKMCSYPDEP